MALSKILPDSKATKGAKKLSVFDENDSRRLSNFLQTHTFWKFHHISRTYNQINYRNIWFPKVIIILIMTGQVLFFNVFSEKDPHLNAVEKMKNKIKTKTKMKMKMNFRFCFHFDFDFDFCFCFWFLKVFAFLLTPRGLEVP